ncbi:MAG: glycosyltransferase family 2 protein [Bacteroidetes bacterium]|nr:MAG: glycosyltransferase family 2 protein [Bacteroidota bacterium]
MAARPSAISVVICTYNRAKFIGSALESLAQQQLSPALYEILIVDNNSSDATAVITKAFIANHPELDARYIFEGQQGLSYARNRGLAEAKYDIITYIDDDAYAKPDFLQAIHDFLLAHPEIVGVGGKVIPRYEAEEPAWMNPFLYGLVSKVDYGDRIKKFPRGRYPIGCNMTYRKAILQQVGGFNNALKWRADDKFINRQVQTISTEVYYLPQATVEHTIDAARTTDTGFRNVATKFGASESVRVKALGTSAYLSKLLEFLYKLAGSAVLCLYFMGQARFTQGRYTLWYRWLAMQGFLQPSKYL